MAQLYPRTLPWQLRLLYGVSSRTNHPWVVRYRRHLLKHVLGSLGKGCYFSLNIKMVKPGGIDVADRCSFSNSSILDGHGGLSFGESCLIGFENVFLTGTHLHDRCDIPIREQPLITAPVTVGDDVWTGCRVIVLPGVSIGAHTIIGAGSVVTRDVPSGVIAAGVPARVVRDGANVTRTGPVHRHRLMQLTWRVSGLRRATLGGCLGKRH